MNENIFYIAKQFLGTDNLRHKEIPEIKAIYVWEPMKGGKALIIDERGNKLGATSAVGFERHLAEFKERFPL